MERDTDLDCTEAAIAEPLFAAAEKFLRVLDGPPDPAGSNLLALMDALDRLPPPAAFLPSFIDYPDVGHEAADTLRARVCRAFPILGFYRMVFDPLDVYSDDRPVMGDAIDDLADIAGELQEVLALRAVSGDRAAAYHFVVSYRRFWGAHLHTLRYCLHRQHCADPLAIHF